LHRLFFCGGSLKEQIMKRLSILALMLLAIISISGCGEAPPPPPPPEAAPPPEPTKEEIYAQLREALSPLFTAAQNPQGEVQEAAKSQAVTKLQSLKAKYATAKNGPDALKQIQEETEAQVTKMRDAQRWQMLKTFVDFFKIFEPGNEKYLSYVEKADLMLARPDVIVRGFFEVDAELYVFLDVKDKQTKKVTSYKVREGEEMHDGLLRLVHIIGDRQSVEIEYVPINMTWIVKGPDA